MTFKVDDKVRWTSSGTDKTGTVVAVLEPGQTPKDAGFHNHNLRGGSGRDHKTYIVLGLPTTSTSGKPGVYWPVTSLLLPLDRLSTAETAWCIRNLERIRTMMREES